ncbi:MAG: hypothetical protein V7K72_12030, partial [Nostoc sp.]
MGCKQYLLKNWMHWHLSIFAFGRVLCLALAAALATAIKEISEAAGVGAREIEALGSSAKGEI